MYYQNWFFLKWGHFVNAETGLPRSPGESFGLPDATSLHNSVDIALNAIRGPVVKFFGVRSPIVEFR
jgi:hypothetical protein